MAIDALIIVDVQAAFLMPPKFVAKIRRYAGRFRRRVFTRFVNSGDSQFRRLLKMDCCAPKSPDTALLVEPRRGDLVFTKRGYGLSARHIAKLKRLGIRRVIVCGVDTDACVLGVMYSLFDGGIECRVKADLCWSTTGLHKEGMRIIKTQFPAPRR